MADLMQYIADFPQPLAALWSVLPLQAGMIPSPLCLKPSSAFPVLRIKSLVQNEKAPHVQSALSNSNIM